MPAELTNAKVKRRTSRKDLEEYRFDGTHGRELELKRNRGEVSCAECRRLKIKCDKQIPCQSCQRRGCVSLCPNGSLATGQGTRFVLAATEHLHRRVAGLRGRIRQLEDALSGLQAKYSSDPHPLLHEDLIEVDEQDGDVDTASDEPVNKMSREVLDVFGTLSIKEHGISRFFGQTGGSESLLLANLDSDREGFSTPNSSSSTGALSDFVRSFPLSPLRQPPDVRELIENSLPPYEQTLALCETYFEQVSWAFRGVTRMQLVDDMLPVIYKMQGAPPGEDYSGPHGLALVFVILAIGALVGKDPSTALGEHFHQLSRAAISLQSVLEKPSVVTIQTLQLMSIYNGMGGSDLTNETRMETTWSLLTLASQLSKTIGLHRDSARWGLPPKTIQYHRILFWDLFIGDLWQSLHTGRPPTFSTAYIDCGYPQYNDDEAGDFGNRYSVWVARFTVECVTDVLTRTLTAEVPSYATIMELDRKVSEFPLPEGMSSSSNDQATSFQTFILEHVREMLLMYIHRSFFAQAVVEHPVNPLKSAYAHSFLATYRASSTILKSSREQFNIWPNSSSRFWQMWTNAFSAAVVFGTVVTHGPRSPLAQSAMIELEQACILFSKASSYNIRAAKALPILTKLNEKARYALSLVQTEPSTISGDQGNIKQNDIDELSIFAGRTLFVSSQRGTDSSSGTTSPPHSIPFEPSPPRYSSPQPIDPPQLLGQQQSQQPQHQIPRAHPGLASSSYQHHRATLPKAPSNHISDRWSPSSRSSSSADSYVTSPMDSLPYTTYSSSERTHQNSRAAVPSTPSPYGWSSDEPHQQAHHALHLQQQNSNLMQHLPLPASSFPPPPSLFSSPPPLDPLFQACHQQHQPERHSPSQQQPLHQHQPYHVHATPTGLQTLHPHTQYASQYPSPSPHPPSSSSPHQDSQQRYTMYTNGPTTGGYAIPLGTAPPNVDLADLGLASRNSRLDERWGSFITDSGLLEDFRQAK